MNGNVGGTEMFGRFSDNWDSERTRARVSVLYSL